MSGFRLPPALRWGIVIGLALLALAALGQFLRRRAWDEPLLDEPLMRASFPEPPPAEPPLDEPPARPSFAPPAVTADEQAAATEITAELEVVVTPEPAEAPEIPAAPTGQVDPVDGACPATHPIKGNVRTRNGRSERIFHAPGTPYYDRTNANACFATIDDAQAAGFRAPREG
jgi:hypothetical protein